MIAIPHKAKQFLLVLVKVLIVSLAFFYIYNRLQAEKEITIKQLVHFLNVPVIAILFLFSLTNWLLEILKWQNLVNSFKPIRFFEAAQQTFGSLTASIFTPNRIGEYGAKMFYFKKENAKRIVLLNFIHNSSQMLVTILFGIVGFLLLTFSSIETMSIRFKADFISILLILIGFAIIILIAIFFRKIEIYGFSFQKIITKIRQLNRKIVSKVFVLSTLRYLIFSTQFLFLLFTFDPNINLVVALETIFLMYFLSSIIPSIHLMDVAVKSSVAIYLFQTINMESEKIISVTLLMWIFNLVFPVIIGSYFVLRYKPKPI
jgi:uncharacterized membrane protein YbhN (UPF0104 family)